MAVRVLVDVEFASAEGWTLGEGWSIAGGVLIHDGGNRPGSQYASHALAAPLVPGTSYTSVLEFAAGDELGWHSWRGKMPPAAAVAMMPAVRLPAITPRSPAGRS